MKMSFLKNMFKKQILGVDIGQRTIKGVQLKKDSDGRVMLTNHFFQDLSKTSRNYPQIDNQAEILKAAVDIHGLGASHVASTVRDDQVMSFLLSLPPMTDKELAEVVPQEIAEHSNIAIDQHSCDYSFSLLPPQSPGMTSIRAYAVKRDVVLAQMQVLKEVGLRPQNIESEMMAITSMLHFNEYIQSNEVVVVFDLGESHLTSALISDGALSLTKTHETSFGHVNKALQDYCHISYEEAEKIKLSYDFLSPLEDGSKAGMILDDEFTQIFKAVKEAIDFYKECPESYGRIDRILLVGGASQFASVTKIFEIIFQIPAVVVNPFRKIDIFSETEDEEHEEIVGLSPYMGIAVGLALNSIDEEAA